MIKTFCDYCKKEITEDHVMLSPYHFHYKDKKQLHFKQINLHIECFKSLFEEEK